MKRTLSFLMIAACLCVMLVMPATAENAMSATFQDALELLDMFYNYDAQYMIRIANYYFVDWNNMGPVTVPAEEYEAVLNKHFAMSDAQLNAVRNFGYDLTYDADANTYTVKMPGGFGGNLREREYLGYVQNGATYDVFYAHRVYQFLDDVLAADGKTEEDVFGDGPYTSTVEYGGFVYEDSMFGYYTVASLDDYGRKYTVEMNGDTVRIISCAEYTASDLPAMFDDHSHTYSKVVTPPTCTEEGYTTYTCSCGDSYIGDRVGTVEHDWDFGEVTVQPTATAGGTIRYSCYDCNATRTERLGSLGNLAERFGRALNWWDSAYDTLGKTHLIIERVYYDHFMTEGQYEPKVVPAVKYEAALNKHFAIDDATLSNIRNSYSAQYDAETETYTVKFMGGIGGWMTPREYYGYVKNGDTYDVYYREIPYQFLEDVLKAEGKSLSDVIGSEYPSTVEYNGVTYTSGPDGYYAILPDAEDCGKVHTVELNGDVVRILSTKDYTANDLPDSFDHVAVHEHAYEAIVTAPTCTADGYTTHTCACGDYYMTDTVPKISHTYESAVTAPTCAADGYTTYTCTCGDTYTADKTVALGHKWDDGVETLAPTETSDGEKTYTCSVCKDTKKESIAPLNHTHEYASAVTAPTCTENGFTTYTCDCGDSYVDNTVNAAGHSFGAWMQTKAPTYTAQGEEKRECENCDAVETRAVAALVQPDHTDDNDEDEVIYDIPTDSIVSIPENDCFEDDTVVKVEEIVSGEVFETVVEAMKTVAENYIAYEFTATKDNVSVQPSGKLTVTFDIPDGYSINVTVYYMEKNGELEPLKTTVNVAERTVIAELEHFSTYIVADEGSDSHEHDYKAEVTAPTCTEEGYTTYTCECGDSYVDNKVSAVGHSFGEWSRTKAPTTTEEGEEKRVCTECDYVETRSVAVLTESDTNPTDTDAIDTTDNHKDILIAVAIIAVVALGAAVVFIIRKKKA